MSYFKFDLKRIIVVITIMLVATTGMQQALVAETKVKSNPTYYRTVKARSRTKECAYYSLASWFPNILTHVS